MRRGLTDAQVQERVRRGEVNNMEGRSTLTVGKILRKNVFTLFNGINLLLAAAVVWVGAWENAIFFGVAVANTLMGVIQELRAKRTLDKLSILARGKVLVMRNGRQVEIEQEQVVVDDILVLNAGNQIVADAEVVEAEGLEVDESLLSGESRAVQKQTGDSVLSGSFVLAGQARVKVTTVGDDSYAGKLAKQAKQVKKPTAPLMNTLSKIIRVLAVVIIPIGAWLFYQQYTGSGDLRASVLGATAAMVGMIPEGLILLTGVTLTLGALKLARRKALVQALPSIETLARVDVLCLDKTGTITDGTLSLEELVPAKGFSEEKMGRVIGEMMGALQDENATAQTLRAGFESAGEWQVSGLAPFASERKWSGASFVGQGSFVLGAPTFVMPKLAIVWARKIEEYTAKGQRVLCLAQAAGDLPKNGLPRDLKLMGLVVLADHIRPEAAKTFRYFRREGVELKIISGDDAQTVSVIAGKVGVEGAEKFVDVSKLDANQIDYDSLAKLYKVFGRTSPEQKRDLVAALKRNKHTVCMTGDGVNDVLALKEADCGVAMINGSDAARASADFVLMTGDFSAMVDVLKEGRRVINNIENVASLYLVKTIYSVALALLYAFIPAPYPFTPLQMTPMNVFTVGIPSFFLALRKDYEKPQGRFLANILENALPAAIAVVSGILLIQLVGTWLSLPQVEMATLNVLLAASIGFCLLYKVAKPLGRPEKILLGAVMAGFLICVIFLGKIFGYASLLNWSMLWYVPVAMICVSLFGTAVMVARAVGRRMHKKMEF